MNESIENRKVFGMGETILDILFKDNKVMAAVPGGSTFNAIISLGRCKTHAALLSEVGDDQAGDYVLNFMRQNGVDANYMLRLSEMQTPISLAFLNEQNDATYSFYKGPAVDISEMKFPEVKENDIVLFGSYYAIAPHNREHVKTFLEYAKSRGAILYYDVNFRTAYSGEMVKLKPNIIDNLELADIVRGSKDDFDIIYGISEPEKLYRAELSFFSPNLVHTDGAQPVTVFGKGEFSKEYPTEKITTISTIGAGDSFNAGLIYALLACGITHSNIFEGLLPLQWDELIVTAQSFSRDCCSNPFNYISEEFAKGL